MKSLKNVTLGLLAGLAMFAGVERANAVPTYLQGSSTAKFTHDPQLGDAVTPAGTTITPTLTMPTPPTYQFKNTNAPATGRSSVASASVAAVVNATTAGMKIAAGTGVTQTDPATPTPRYLGASSLRIDVDLLFDVPTGPSFGPPASGIATFAVGGTVGAGTGAFASFEAQLDFFDATPIITIDDVETLSGVPTFRSQVKFQQNFFRGSPTSNTVGNPATNLFANSYTTNGVFSKTFSSSELLQFDSNQLFPGQRLQIKGFIEFRADNCETPSEIGFSREATISGAIPTPEPATASLTMLGLGALGLVAGRRTKK